MAIKQLYNPFLPEFRDNPHPFFHRLRIEDPVHFSPTVGVWILTRHADVMAALRDPRFSASSRHWENYDRYFFRKGSDGVSPMAETYDHWMLQMDPPDHTRLRSLFTKAFTPRIVERMRDKIQRLTDIFLDRILARGNGTTDLIPDLAYPLPIVVIAEMLGVPPEDHDKIQRWSAALLPSLSPALSVETSRQVNVAVTDFRDYFRQLAAERRASPREDLMTAMVQAQDRDDKLNEAELLATCVLLAFAGHASTVQFIANAVHALLQHPDQLNALRAEPGLLDGALEESLRFESPLQLVYRTTLEDTAIGGKTIPKNQMVFPSLVAANRDPALFADPDRFDIRRETNRHVAFGNHIHYCAGAPLARLEANIVVETIFRRLPNLRLAGKVEREPSLILRGIKTLPLAFG
jgi:pimeloyl-[acyl-carrier protein] synthase